MKTFLIKTPEYKLEYFNEVNDLLRSFEGPLEFVTSSYEFDESDHYFLNYSLFPNHPFNFPTNTTKIKFDPKQRIPLSWRELFSLCSFYRELFSIDPDDFVVLLTDRSNALNWFSAFQERNIFVHTAGWTKITQKNAKYPISYQVIENIMQSLMKIDISETPNDYVHDTTRGCMNDFCKNKEEILSKLRTADICDDCQQKIGNEGIDHEILSQTMTIFNGIRNELIFKLEPKKVDPIPIIVDENSNILLPSKGLEIKLTPLFKTLYLFFLKNEQGVKLVDLSDHYEELFKIYIKLRPGVAKESAIKSIKDLTHPFGASFNSMKSKTNRIITTLLDDPLADFYRISGSSGKRYSIKVPRNLIDIRF